MTDTYSALQSTMLNDVNRLSVISQNLANATTAGYKKQIPVNRAFTEYMSFENTQSDNSTEQYMIRYSEPYMDSVTDPAMGTVKYTGNSLDLIAGGNSYFSVLTPSGVAYTKQGSFHVDNAGVIVNPLGYPLLSDTGEIIVNDKEPTIDKSGTIVVDGNTVGKLRVVTFEPDTPLNSIGLGLYEGNSESVEAVIDRVNIKQGYLEMSNVTVMEEMVKLIEVSRHFEIAQKFMMGYDEMLDNGINRVGEL